MFRPRVHPGGFQAVFLLEGCVGDGELVLCAELEQEAPVVVTVTNAVSSKDSFPGLRIPPNSSVEVANGRRIDMMRSEWPVGSLSSLEAMEFLTMSPTPERRLSVDGFPDQ